MRSSKVQALPLSTSSKHMTMSLPFDANAFPDAQTGQHVAFWKDATSLVVCSSCAILRSHHWFDIEQSLNSKRPVFTSFCLFPWLSGRLLALSSKGIYDLTQQQVVSIRKFHKNAWNMVGKRVVKSCSNTLRTSRDDNSASDQPANTGGSEDQLGHSAFQQILFDWMHCRPRSLWSVIAPMLIHLNASQFIYVNAPG